MTFDFRRPIRVLMILALGAAASGTPNLLPQDYVVSAADLHHELLNAAQTRLANLARIEKFLSSEPARKALKAAKIDEEQVQRAVPYLSDEELARLAKQTDQIQRNFAAGALTTEQLTYIVIALATAVIVILIVES